MPLSAAGAVGWRLLQAQLLLRVRLQLLQLLGEGGLWLLQLLRKRHWSKLLLGCLQGHWGETVQLTQGQWVCVRQQVGHLLQQPGVPASDQHKDT
jgi:hypothetical protein